MCCADDERQCGIWCEGIGPEIAHTKQSQFVVRSFPLLPSIQYVYSFLATHTQPHTKLLIKTLLFDFCIIFGYPLLFGYKYICALLVCVYVCVCEVGGETREVLKELYIFHKFIFLRCSKIHLFYRMYIQYECVCVCVVCRCFCCWLLE